SVSLPRRVLKDFGPVTGVRRHAPGQNVSSALHGKLMDQFFLGASIYRQQFLADIERRYEKARRTSLYKSQGRQIVPDTEIEALTNGAFRVNRHTEEWGFIEELAERFGIIPESWIRRLAENKAVEEAEHIMYAWHKTSRLGRSLVGEA